MKRIVQIVRAAALLAIIAFTFSGCGSGIRYVRQDMTEYAPKPETATVEIHRGGVFEPHVVMGTMVAERPMKVSFDDRSTYDTLIESMVKRARKEGADALLEVQPVTTEGGGLRSKVQVTATVVRYLQKTATVRSGESAENSD